MKKLLLLLPFGIFAALSNAQISDSVSLDECIRIADVHFTGNKQLALLSEASGYRIKNYTTRWFPSLGVTGQATYQSETVQMKTYNPVTGSLMTIDLPLDQYKLQAEFNQQLYDGGMTHVQKEIENTGLGIDLQQVKVDLLAFQQTINQLYFSVVLMQKNHQTLLVSLDELRERKSSIESGVNHGTVIAGYLNTIIAEELTMEQRILEVDFTRISLLNQLSILLDTSFSSAVSFSLPGFTMPDKEEIQRPEYTLFDLQKQQLTNTEKLLNAGNLPKFSAFSQLGYGRPGFDFLNENFHTYYLVGIGLKWNFFRYGETTRQKKVLNLSKQIIDTKQESFDKNIRSALDREWQNIEKFREMIVRDKKIMDLRKEVTRSSFSRLENGTITPADFLADSNDEIQARLQLENHEIMFYNRFTIINLLKAIFNHETPII